MVFKMRKMFELQTFLQNADNVSGELKCELIRICWGHCPPPPSPIMAPSMVVGFIDFSNNTINNTFVISLTLFFFRQET